MACETTSCKADADVFERFPPDLPLAWAKITLSVSKPMKSAISAPKSVQTIVASLPNSLGSSLVSRIPNTVSSGQGSCPVVCPFFLVRLVQLRHWSQHRQQTSLRIALADSRLPEAPIGVDEPLRGRDPQELITVDVFPESKFR